MTKEQPTIHVGIDVSKDKLAVAIAGGGVRDEVLSWGTFENTPASVDRLLKKLSGRGLPVSVCYEAGPTGYSLCTQVRTFGFDCCVLAPSLIPVRAGERVKTDRLDAIRLARLGFSETAFLHRNLLVHLAEKILRSHPFSHGEDYRKTCFASSIPIMLPPWMPPVCCWFYPTRHTAMPSSGASTP